MRNLFAISNIKIGTTLIQRDAVFARDVEIWINYARLPRVPGVFACGRFRGRFYKYVDPKYADSFIASGDTVVSPLAHFRSLELRDVRSDPLESVAHFEVLKLSKKPGECLSPVLQLIFDHVGGPRSPVAFSGQSGGQLSRVDLQNVKLIMQSEPCYGFCLSSVGSRHLADRFRCADTESPSVCFEIIDAPRFFYLLDMAMKQQDTVDGSFLIDDVRYLSFPNDAEELAEVPHPAFVKHRDFRVERECRLLWPMVASRSPGGRKFLSLGNLQGVVRRISRRRLPL